MQKVLLLSALFLTVITGLVAQSTDTLVVYREGRLSNGITLKSSTKADVMAIYGKKCKTEVNYFAEYWYDLGYATVERAVLYYKHLGLTFTFYTLESMGSKELLVEIDIQMPCLAKTPEGLVLGQSTFADVNSTYGNAQWMYSNKNKRATKDYGNISFSTPMPKPVKTFNEAEFNKNYTNAVITRMMISRPVKE